MQVSAIVLKLILPGSDLFQYCVQLGILMRLFKP